MAAVVFGENPSEPSTAIHPAGSILDASVAAQPSPSVGATLDLTTTSPDPGEENL